MHSWSVWAPRLSSCSERYGWLGRWQTKVWFQKRATQGSAVESRTHLSILASCDIPILLNTSGQETKYTSVDPFITKPLFSFSLEKPHHFEDTEISQQFSCQKTVEKNHTHPHLQSHGECLEGRTWVFLKSDLSSWHSDGVGWVPLPLMGDWLNK